MGPLTWVEYINAVLPSPLSVDENEVIVVKEPTYFDKLRLLLEDTSNRVIANYLMWRAAAYSSQYLTDELRERQLVYDEVITGKRAQKARWKECIDVVMER